MSNYFKHLLLATAILALTTPASAIVIVGPTTQTFNFTGDCDDCFSGEGSATATLTLAGNYALGTDITSDNFISFAYDGTDLVDPFTVLANDPDLAVGGSMTTIPGANSFFVFGTDGNFQTFDTGLWCADGNEGCQNRGSDVGTNGTFSSSTPEPTTMGLLGLGLAGIAVAGRRFGRKK